MDTRKNKRLPWVAFIDLLGTKESSRRSRSSLGEVLRIFSDQVIAQRTALGPQSKLFHFSDCAFLEIGNQEADLIGFFVWLAGIQWRLYQAGHYFKCAVVEGELNNVAKDPDPVDRDRFTSIAFSSTAAVRAYELHESFKGIGVIFDEDVVVSAKQLRIADATNPGIAITHCFEGGRFNPFVQGFFISDVRGGNVEAKPYWDFKLLPRMLLAVPRRRPVQNANDLFPETLDGELDEPDSFRQIMRQFAKANLKSEKYGRYYMSLLSAVISSSDFSKVEVSAGGGFRAPDNSIEIRKAPLIYKRLIAQSAVLHEIKNVPGFPYLMFRLIDALLSGCKTPDQKILAGKSMALALADYKEIFRFIGFANPSIICEQSREIILDAVGENLSKNSH